jgi:rhizosphere induced protein
MATQYSLTFINQSTLSHSFLCYQQDPNIGVPNVVSLAWFAKKAHPNAKIVFKWQIDYSFMWSETGVLTPGVQFVASEEVIADPQGLSGPNKIPFLSKDGAFLFGPPSVDGTLGSLTINNGPGFPADSASVGIAMSGSGTFAVPAAPLFNAIFTPHPQYWIAFGDFEEGEVLDITQISSKANVVFPPNVYAMTAIYGADGRWTIKRTSEVNALLSDSGLVAYLSDRTNRPALALGKGASLPNGQSTTSPKKVKGVTLKGVSGATYSATSKVTVYNKTEDSYEYQIMTDQTDVTLDPGTTGVGEYRVTNNSGGTITYEWVN